MGNAMSKAHRARIRKLEKVFGSRFDLLRWFVAASRERFGNARECYTKQGDDYFADEVGHFLEEKLSRDIWRQIRQCLGIPFVKNRRRMPGKRKRTSTGIKHPDTGAEIIAITHDGGFEYADGSFSKIVMYPEPVVDELPAEIGQAKPGDPSRSKIWELAAFLTEKIRGGKIPNPLAFTAADVVALGWYGLDDLRTVKWVLEELVVRDVIEWEWQGREDDKTAVFCVRDEYRVEDTPQEADSGPAGARDVFGRPNGSDAGQDAAGAISEPMRVGQFMAREAVRLAHELNPGIVGMVLGVNFPDMIDQFATMSEAELRSLLAVHIAEGTVKAPGRVNG